MEMEEIAVEAEKTGGTSATKEGKSEEEESHYSKLQSQTEDLYAEAKFLTDPSKTKAGGILDVQDVRLWRVESLCLGLLCLVLILVILLLVIKHQNAPSIAEPKSVLDKTATVVFSRQNLQSNDCSRGWVQHSESCFFLSGFRLTWDDAQKNCSSLGGNLAVVASRSVQNFLTQSGGVQYWIGLRRDGTWKWVGRKPLTQGYWSDFYSKGNCVMLDAKRPNDKNWIISSCTRPTYYICERSVSSG